MKADTKQLRNRIKSVNSTLQLTNAMGLVATAKLGKSLENMEKSLQYHSLAKDIVSALAACPECRESQYITASSSPKMCIIIVGGDRGLAGGYNANVFRTAEQFTDAEFIAIGKRACERYGGNYSAERFTPEQASALAAELCRRFAEKKLGNISIISTEYVSMLSQNCRIRQLLPIVRNSDTGKEVILEPDANSVFEKAINIYLASAIFSSVRESFACETAARRSAMDSASKNAVEMIDELKLAYNLARQSAITQEITEIVAGSEI